MCPSDLAPMIVGSILAVTAVAVVLLDSSLRMAIRLFHSSRPVDGNAEPPGRSGKGLPAPEGEPQ